jgi:hypothetical protein
MSHQLLSELNTGVSLKSMQYRILTMVAIVLVICSSDKLAVPNVFGNQLS